MYASMASAAALCIPVEGFTHFIPPLKATLHRDSIPRDIVDSARRVLVLVVSMAIGGASDGGELNGWWQVD